MNLIEQLGGYEETKKHLDSCWCDDDNKTYLLEKLLEYRRQHNIFEVGDKVVYQDGSGLDGLFEIEALTKTGKPKSLRTKRFGGFPCGWCLVRHATDAEIAAGYRL